MKAAKKQAAAWVKGQIAPSQIKAIHATVHKLGLDDDAYRDILKSRYSVKSCKGLSWAQAEELLESLNGQSKGGRSRGCAPTRHALKYTDMDFRPGFANGSQLRLIDAMWNQVTRAEGEEAQEKALNSFCYRIAGVANLKIIRR
jgi:hypothetical protein